MDIVAKIERADGGVSIMHLTPKQLRVDYIDHLSGRYNPKYLQSISDNELYALNPKVFDSFIDQTLESERVRIGAPNITRIERADVPEDRTFRNAWGHDLQVDMEKAREIHMDRIRVARDAALKELDIETMKGNDVQAEKQVLRDLPQTFDITVATTPEELKALWPQELEAPNDGQITR